MRYVRRARAAMLLAGLAGLPGMGCAGPPPPPASPALSPATEEPSSSRDDEVKASGADEDGSVPESPLLASLLARGTGSALRRVRAAPEAHRFQVLFGVVRPGERPTIERHGHRVDAEYVFPASALKVPIALATMERLAALRVQNPELDRETPLRIVGARGAIVSGSPLTTTLARETYRALVVSDNASTNRLLAFTGHRELHETLWALGLRSARVRTGFATSTALGPVEVSPRVEGPGGEVLLPARRSDLALPPNDATGLEVGEATREGGRRVEGPLSFAEKNAMRLVDLQDALVRIVRPDLVPEGAPRGRARPDDLAALATALGTLPSESGLPGFERRVTLDRQLVPFLRGLERVRPRSELAIHSKLGQAFGFVVANAYVEEKATGRAFFLAASVYANTNGVMNDDEYDYDTIALPALADLAELTARHAFSP